jgi:hypothetical protein
MVGKGLSRTPQAVYGKTTGLFGKKHHVYFAEDILFARDSWHGRIMACRGVRFADGRKTASVIRKRV